MSRLFVAAALAALFLASPALAAAVGDAAPDFTAQAASGKTVHLSDYKGKIVVLEWTNGECPFVRKHYDSGNMQKLQKAAAEKGVVWLSVNSSAKGKQGHVDATAALALIKERQAAPAELLLDDEGKLGRLYGAKATPHMFVIGKDGVLAYAGAIDDKPSTNPADVASAKNYVTAALEALDSGKLPEVQQTAAYGCGVKYAE